MDAKLLLAKKIIRDAEKGKQSEIYKFKKKTTVPKDVKKKALHPYKRIDWRGKIKFYATAIIATSSRNSSDGIFITGSALTKAANSVKGVVMPVYYYGKSNEPYGSSKVEGVVTKNGIFFMMAQVTFVVDRKLAEEISNGKYCCVPDMHVNKSIMLSNGDERLDDIDIVSINLIPYKDSADKKCKIIDVYKDEDIDKKLES